MKKNQWIWNPLHLNNVKQTNPNITINKNYNNKTMKSIPSTKWGFSSGEKSVRICSKYEKIDLKTDSKWATKKSIVEIQGSGSPIKETLKIPNGDNENPNRWIHAILDENDSSALRLQNPFLNARRLVGDAKNYSYAAYVAASNWATSR